MDTPSDSRIAVITLMLWLALFSANAHAELGSAGILDDVLSRYSAAASTWAATITERASWLFWTLALISMVWTFGMMALRHADIGEFFAEFVRFTIFTGFFWWLLRNGPNFAVSIMDSLRTIGGNATGLGNRLSPSGIVDIGFNIFFKMIDESLVLSPVKSAAGIIISAAILIIMALIGVNMLLLMVSGWILAYAGVFFLGFGGSRWTSEIAINYFRTVLSIAAQLFTMVLLVGIGKSFVDVYYANMSAGINLKELGVMLIVAVILLALVNKVPSLIGQLALGGGTGSLGAGFGTGAVMGAAAMGAAAASTAGASLAAGAFGAGGGSQALMAAISKAYDTESARDDFSDITSASVSGGGQTSGGHSGIGSPDGDMPSLGEHDSQYTTGGWPEFPPEYGRGSGTSSAQSTEKSTGKSSGSDGGDKASSRAGQSSKQLGGDSTASTGGMATAETNNGSAASGDGDVFGTNFAAGDSFAGSKDISGSSTFGSLQDSFADNAKDTGIGQDGTEGNATGGNTKNGQAGAPTGLSPGELPQGGTLAAAGAVAAKVGRIAAGTAANLAQGTWDVTRAKGSELKQAASERLSETTGGKIAAAIKARGANAEPGMASSDTASPDSADSDAGAASASESASDGNSLSAGKTEPVDAEAEVAAFRDGNSSTSYPSV